MIAVGDDAAAALGPLWPGLRAGLEARFGPPVGFLPTIPTPGGESVASAERLSTREFHAALRSLPLPVRGHVLGVTCCDLYAPSMQYVFGEADPLRAVAVVSLRRLREGGPDRLAPRILAEAVHEFGHTHGLSHCSADRCVMSFSSHIEDTDRKGADFCRRCARALAAGRSAASNFMDRREEGRYHPRLFSSGPAGAALPGEPEQRGSVMTKWETFKAEFAVRMRWIGWGMIFVLTGLFVYANYTPVKFDLLFWKIEGFPAAIIYVLIFLLGWFSSKVHHFISNKMKVLEVKYRAILQARDAEVTATAQAQPAQQASGASTAAAAGTAAGTVADSVAATGLSALGPQEEPRAASETDKPAPERTPERS